MSEPFNGINLKIELYFSKKCIDAMEGKSVHKMFRASNKIEIHYGENFGPGFGHTSGNHLLLDKTFYGQKRDITKDFGRLDIFFAKYYLIKAALKEMKEVLEKSETTKSEFEGWNTN